MSYSDLYFKTQKNHIGTLLTVALFSIAGFIGILYQGNSLRVSKAGGSKLAEPPMVVNLRTTQAGIFWKSDQPQIGWVMYGTDKGSLNKISYDERDTESVQKPYLYHYVFLIDLLEDQKYYYKIFCKTGNEIVSYMDSDNSPYKLTTPKNISLEQTIRPAYGKILLSNNLPAADTFVIFNFENYYPLLAITKLSGEFMIPLNSFIDKTTNNIIIPSLDSKVEIMVFNHQQKTKITASINQTNPFSQSIVLGKDYDLIGKTEVLGVKSERAKLSAANISIIYPKEDSIIASQKPLIKGMALPGKTVIVNINSIPEYNFRSVADSQGNWKAILPEPIINGNYTLTMKTTDEQDKEIIIQRHFNIAKSGEQVLGTATAEPTLEMPTPTLSSQYFTPTPSPLVSGMNNNFLIIVSSSLIILGFGMLLVF